MHQRIVIKCLGYCKSRAAVRIFTDSVQKPDALSNKLILQGISSVRVSQHLKLVTNGTSGLKLIIVMVLRLVYGVDICRFNLITQLKKLIIMDPAIHTFIKNCLNGQPSPARIPNLIFTQYNIVLPNSVIRQYRANIIYTLLMEKIGHPHGDAIDCLIAESSNQKDSSYLYVIHDV